MDSYFYKGFTLFLFLSASASNFAQHYFPKPENYNLEAGISQSFINCIAQDKSGFLWIGTQEGLNCFDGYEFKVFKNDQADSTTLSNNNIRDIYVDNKDNIWIGTHGGGLNKFDRRTNTFSRFVFTSGYNPEESNNIITKIIPSGKDVLYLGTEKYGLLEFKIAKGELQRVTKFKISSLENNINSVLSVSDDSLLLGTDAGLYIYDKVKRSVKRFLSSSFGNRRVTCLYKRNDGNFFAGTFSGKVFEFNLNQAGSSEKKQIVNQVMDFGVPLTFISSDRQGSILIGTDSSFAVFNEKNLMPLIDSYYFQKRNGLLNLRANIVFIDRSNVLWIGTINMGLFKVAPIYKKFNILNFSNAAVGSNNSVWSILKEKEGTIWIGTDGNGLIRFKTKSGEINNWKKQQYNRTSLSNNSVSSILKDKSGHFWFATFGGGINYMTSDGNFKHYLNIQGNDQSIGSNHVWKIFEDRHGNIWIGSRGGLDCLTFPGRKFIHYKHDENNPSSLSNNSVLTIYEDSGGILWVGTYGGGLNKFDKRTGKFKHYVHSDKDNSSISDNSVMSICEDSNKDLWLGCDIGMNKLDRLTGKFTRYYEKDGLPNNVVYSVIADSNNNIWASTNYGISRFNITKKVFKNYDYRDDLQSNEFNEGAYFYSNDGEIYFGGINGINYFKPSSIHNNSNLPIVVIERIKIFNSEIPFNRFNLMSAKLKLSYDKNYIQIEFAGLEFTDPVKNQYKYILEGFDKNWINAGTRRLAIYTNLDPGEYIFKVKASNNDGVWSDREAALYLSVLPPIWMTWWFKITIGFLIISVVYSIHILKVKRLLEMEHLRLQIASDLHDEVGATLTSLSIQTQLLNLEKDKQKLSSRISLIEALSRRAIETMSDVVWSIDSRNDTLEDLINRMKDFSFQLLNDKQIKTFYSIDISNPAKKISIDVRHNIYLIFKEAINNIAKHSNAGNVEVKILTDQNRFEMHIKDDGVGLNLDGNKNGNGLRNMMMRAKRTGGKLELISDNGLTLKLILNKI